MMERYTGSRFERRRDSFRFSATLQRRRRSTDVTTFFNPSIRHVTIPVILTRLTPSPNSQGGPYRTNTLRLARWKEIDFDKALWVVPAATMRMNRPIACRWRARRSWSCASCIA